jgi:hypothetical protein
MVDAVEAKLPMWYSYILLGGLFVIDFLAKALCARRDVYSFISYLNIRTILIVSIFDKVAIATKHMPEWLL